jgi:hypothetical protein
MILPFQKPTAMHVRWVLHRRNVLYHEGMNSVNIKEGNMYNLFVQQSSNCLVCTVHIKAMAKLLRNCDEDDDIAIDGGPYYDFLFSALMA